jgi:hypothetical protein
MKIEIYKRFLNTTSFALNVCVKKHWWNMAAKLIEFRKKHVATNLRNELCVK